MLLANIVPNHKKYFKYNYLNMLQNCLFYFLTGILKKCVKYDA
jgi:hypothetical protein